MYNLEDKIISKKTHPCGGNIWTIIRTGADYKLKCDKCGRVIMIGIDELKKMAKQHIPQIDKEKND